MSGADATEGWFYADASGTERGPVNFRVVRANLRIGSLTLDSLVWKVRVGARQRLAARPALSATPLLFFFRARLAALASLASPPKKLPLRAHPGRAALSSAQGPPKSRCTRPRPAPRPDAHPT